MLQALESADDPAERLALLHIIERIFQHAVDDAKAEGADHDPFIVERGQQHVPGLVRFPQHLFVGDEGVLEMHRATAHRAHTEFGERGDLHARCVDRHPEQGQPLVLLFSVLVAARDHQQIVGDMGGGGPDLFAIEFPAPLDPFGCRGHRAQQVGAAARLGKGDRGLQLPGGDQRQIFRLLFGRPIKADRFRPGKAGDAPDPGEATQRPGQFARQQHLHDNIAALPVILLRYADAVKARFGEFVPQREGVVVFVLFQRARPFLGHFLVDPAPRHVLKGTIFLWQFEIHVLCLSCLSGRVIGCGRAACICDGDQARGHAIEAGQHAGMVARLERREDRLMLFQANRRQRLEAMQQDEAGDQTAPVKGRAQQFAVRRRGDEDGVEIQPSGNRSGIVVPVQRRAIVSDCLIEQDCLPCADMAHPPGIAQPPQFPLHAQQVAGRGEINRGDALQPMRLDLHQSFGCQRAKRLTDRRGADVQTGGECGFA